MAIERIGLTTEYKADGLGETKPVLRIGGKTEKFVPNVNMSFQCESGSEQYFLNINRKSVTVDKESSTLATEKLALTVGNETDIWHINEDGTFEWDIEFAEKPPTNVFSWELLVSDALQFYYQPILSEEYKKEQNIIQSARAAGSYAVYCDKTGHYKDENGKTKVNYMTGKLMHIYRPICTDAGGKTTWAELLIEKGVLAITIPQQFLDNAKYPVTLDPTFGITASSENGYGLDVNRLYAVVVAAPSTSGTGDSISAYWAWVESGRYFKGVLLNHDDSDNIVSNGIGNVSDELQETGWATSAFGAAPTIASGTVYCPGLLGSGTSMYLAYDYTGTTWPDDWYGRVDSTNSYASPENPGSLTTADNRFCIYCTYTESGGGASSTPSSTLARGIAVGMFKGMGIGSGQYP